MLRVDINRWQTTEEGEKDRWEEEVGVRGGRGEEEIRRDREQERDVDDATLYVWLLRITGSHTAKCNVMLQAMAAKTAELME